MVGDKIFDIDDRDDEEVDDEDVGDVDNDGEELLESTWFRLVSFCMSDCC